MSVVVVMGGARRRVPGSPGTVDQRLAVGLLEHLGAQHVGGRPERDLAPVEAQHALPAAGLRDLVRGDQQRAALAGQAARAGSRGARR